MNRTVFVSGAGGYIGRALTPRLQGAGFRVVGLTRASACPTCDANLIGDLSEAPPDLSQAGARDIFVHMAAKVHDHAAPQGAFMRDTVLCAENVASAIARSKLGHVIHVSSIGARIALEQEDASRPYGRAKLAAERAFSTALADRHGISHVTLRPPAIYGPGAPGNFAILEALVRKGIPLPFGLAVAKRDYLFIDNLIDLLLTLCRAPCATLARANNSVFEPSDGVPVSTRRLIMNIAELLDKPARLLPIPLGFLCLAGRLAGRKDQVLGAISPLSVRRQPSLEKAFGWTAPVSLHQGLAQMYHSHVRCRKDLTSHRWEG